MLIVESVLKAYQIVTCERNFSLMAKPKENKQSTCIRFIIITLLSKTRVSWDQALDRCSQLLGT